MICEKCGKSNIDELSQCAYCGAEMPLKTGGGGFADILSYNSGGATPPRPIKTESSQHEILGERIREEDMQKLLKKSDNIIKSTKVNSLFGLVAIALSILILISSIVFGIITINIVKGYKEETVKQIEEITTSVDGRMTKIEEIISKTEPTGKPGEVDSSETNNEDTKDNSSAENQDEEENKDKNGDKDQTKEKNPSTSPRTDAEGNINQ